MLAVGHVVVSKGCSLPVSCGWCWSTAVQKRACELLEKRRGCPLLQPDPSVMMSTPASHPSFLLLINCHDIHSHGFADGVVVVDDASRREHL